MSGRASVGSVTPWREFRAVMKRFPFKLLVIAVAVAAGWWRFQGAELLERQRFYRFDPKLWANSKPADRYYMARYLVDQHALAGLTREEVVAKLGEASGDAYMLYDLGPERGSLFKVDNDWLEITLPGGKVDGVRIRPD